MYNLMVILGFQRLVGTLKSPCEIPKRNYLAEEMIPNIYEVVKDQLCTEIGSLQNTISLSVEDWISLTGETYSTVSLHYISVNMLNLFSLSLSGVAITYTMLLHYRNHK